MNSIRPNFCFIHQLLITIPSFIIPAIIITLIFAHLLDSVVYKAIHIITYLYYFLSNSKNELSDFLAHFIGNTGLLIFPTVCFFIFLLIIKLFYNRVTFSLDDTGITYTINFIIYSQKHVNYSDIKEINLDQGPLQRLFKLATIKITTHATTANAGIELYNLKPYHEVYEFLMSKKNNK